MKRTVKLSLGMSFIMLALVMLAPHLASPKLVLRFLPKDIYEAGKDHPVRCPFIHGDCAEGPVEVNAGLIPVKACPFQPSTSALYGDLSQLFQGTLRSYGRTGQNPLLFRLHTRTALLLFSFQKSILSAAPPLQ